ncbi:MAG: bifunctional diaminohydroxyphosphoribosylaminopyrimidine deaminase/5-amino-6-(5-phosphoribosylamino)uracil reductase RibD, partial [Candidatus Brocadiae bacterium]|nr:bifunctional diaminohydroxyphosphoribosylaminopyrimidine deaminase/5-amino-6-(5-phosphoribosylamino)uracil reductase RibD [Candidatus Brocadiia bacterium]
MAFSEQDRAFMHRALALAEQGRGSVEPNPMVGAVIARGGRAVGEGYYQQFGGPHAEVLALREAGELARGAAMYVTLEPCDHEGKTPACAPAVAESGLRRVVIAALDPTARKKAGGVEILTERGVSVQVGLCREEAARLNAGFFKLAATGRPLVIAKWAMSADGKIATATGSARWISSPEARKLVHRVRGRVDCVIVGSRTALGDDPLLTCRQAERRRVAARLVLCGAGLPAADSRLARTVGEAPVLLAYPADHPPEGLDGLVELGCEALAVQVSERAPRRVDPEKLLEELGARRMTNVLVEGGGEALGSFFDARLVD